jgi:hypothetical protein
MKMQDLGLITAVIAISLTGCATSPDELTTSYVSPAKYMNYDCQQIIMEMDHVSNRTVYLYESLDKKADNDAAQLGIGLVLFWPALFFLEGGDGPEANEYSNLKGEYEALRKVAVQNKCGPDLPTSPDKIISAKMREKKENQNKESAVKL